MTGFCTAACVLYASDQSPVAFSTSAGAAPYVVWRTRCMQLVIEGSHECLPYFQPKPPWRHHALSYTVSRLKIVARISPTSVQFTSMEAKAWTCAEVLNCKNCQLELLCYNKVRHSFDATMLQGQEMELCTTTGDLLFLPNQRWYSLGCDCSCDLANASVVIWVEYLADEVFKSLDPGNITMTTSDLQPPKILLVLVISKRAPTMSGTTSSTCYNQDHFQEGRGVIVVATAVFAQGFVGHGYYLGFDHDDADNGYVLDWISIHHNCCFYLVKVYSNFDYRRDSDHVQEHRVHWDPGGCQWCRLGVKPSFKKGGMLGAPVTCTCTWAAPSTSTWARTSCAPP